MTDLAGLKLVWDILAKLIDKGFELFKGQSEHREKFLGELIGPLHTNFEHLYAEHLVTFERVRTMLSSLTVSAHEIAAYLAQREVLERGSVELIDRVGVDSPFLRSDELKGMYERYVFNVAQCLASPTRDANAHARYYYALHDVVRDLERASLLQESQEPRRHALSGLDEIVSRLQRFHASVQADYQGLRARCAL